MSHDNVTLTVNGQEIEAVPGRLLIHVLQDLGIHVPTLCHDDRLTPYGGCRLCVVERSDGRGGLIPACSTPVQHGMTIDTDTDNVINSRRNQLQMLVLNHRMECPTCARTGDCRFQDLLYEIGTPEEALPFELVRAPRDTDSPVIERDPEKCIICGRCVRLCEEVQGLAAIGIVGRGLDASITTFGGQPLDCEFCGQCVTACPVGALVARPHVSDVPVWQRDAERTTCSFCACGCELTVQSYEGRLISVTGDMSSQPNHGKMCPKGWLGHDLMASDQRVTRPMVRRDGVLVETSWEEALQVAASGLQASREAGGSLFAIAGARTSCEDAYALQRLVRGGIGSPHVAVASTGGLDALTDGLASIYDRPRSQATFGDLAAADTVLVVRGDPSRSHALVKTEIVQNVTQRGGRLILAHGLSGGLERHAEPYLPLRPGSDGAFLDGVCAALLESGGPAALDESLPNFAEWRQAVEEIGVAAAAEASGVDPDAIRDVASALAASVRPVVVVVTGLGIPGDEVAATRSAGALAGLLGPTCKLMVCTERSNVQGLLDVGLMPGLLPGYRPAGDADAVAELESLTGCTLPRDPGLSIEDGLAAAARGEVSTLWLMGVDDLPRSCGLEAACAGAGTVIVQDAFLGNTSRWADVVLPVAILTERSGSLVGCDGVRRPLRRAVRPPQVPQDGELILELARRAGIELPPPADLVAEMEKVVGWPFEVPRLVRLAPPSAPPSRAVDAFLLDAAPQLFHSGSLTYRSPVLRELAPTIAVRIHPTDAAEVGVSGGEVVAVAGDGGELLLRARIDPTVRPGTVVVPWYGTQDSASALQVNHSEPLSVKVRRS